MKRKGKLELVEPSLAISQSYAVKSGNCLKSARVLLAEKLYENSITEAYYSMYNSALSLLFRCGIKCENHAAAIVLLGELFHLDALRKTLSDAKTERIDKQYYVTDPANFIITEETAIQMICAAEQFILELRAYLGRLSTSEIEPLRKQLRDNLVKKGKLSLENLS